MKIKYNELQSVVKCVLPMLSTHSLIIKEADVKIDRTINLISHMIYQGQSIKISASFLLDYKDGAVVVSQILGSADYLMFKVNIMNVLKQVFKDDCVVFGENELRYVIKLPIERIDIMSDEMDIIIK